MLLAFEYSVVDSTNTATNNRKAGITFSTAGYATSSGAGGTIVYCKTTPTSGSPAIVAIANLSIVEIAYGDYYLIYDPELYGDASCLLDCGTGLPSYNDRFITLSLTRESGRVLTALPAVAPAASGGVLTVGTGAGQLTPDGAGHAVLAATPPTAVQVRQEMDANSTQLLGINSNVLGITSNTARTTTTVPAQLPIPTAGSTAYEIDLILFDAHGQNENADAAPTVHVRNSAGTSRDGGLSSTTMTAITSTTGRYKVTYSVTSADASEALIFDFTATVASVARTISVGSYTAPYFATTFNTGDRTVLNSIPTLIGTPIGASLVADVQTRSTYAGADTAGTTSLLSRLTVGRAANLDNLDAAVSSRSTFAGGSVTVAGYATGQDPATLVWGATTRSLSAAGLDAIVIETGLNARQALSVALASMAGVLSGASTTSVTIKNAAGSATRIAATVDSTGNRTAITLSPPA